MKIKQKKGISLIVLAITIIVMIILATSIILSLDGSGIIEKASGAVDKINLENLKEEIQTKLILTEWKTRNMSAEELENELKSISGANVEKITLDAWTVEKQGVCVTVYQTGEIIESKVDVWDGTSKVVEIKNGDWYIYTCEELKFFADYVNNSNKLTDEQKIMVAQAGYNESDYVIETTTKVHLMENLDLGARETNGLLTSGSAWVPIANGGIQFVGIFEGNDHAIMGMYIKQSGNFGGLFGRANKVSNLTIKDGYIEIAGGCVGAIVGLGGTVTNCHNINTNVNQTSSYTVGGIAGQVTIKIENCSNSGNITGVGIQIGGILGNISASGIIEKCENSGTITGKGASAIGIGGIVGYVGESGQINNSKNKGKIIAGKQEVGGITGSIDKAVKIDNCINSGDVMSPNAQCVGGIVALVSTDCEIINCTNNANVSGNGWVGGIAGQIDVSSKIVSGINFGDILNISERTGGIVGNAKTFSEVSESINLGKVTSSKGYIGGIAGASSGTIDTCYNAGEIKSTGQSVLCVSGICGILSGESILKTYNTANILIEGNSASYVGGIVGGLAIYGGQETITHGSISNNYNIGKIVITGSGASKIGGVIGGSDNTAFTRSNNYYLIGSSSIQSNTEGESKSEVDMKTTAFVTLLNTGLTTAAWEIRSGENNGYPVLNDLKTIQ